MNVEHPPAAVRFASTILIFEGAWSIVRLVISLFLGSPILNFAILQIPLGKALLRGSKLGMKLTSGLMVIRMAFAIWELGSGAFQAWSTGSYSAWPQSAFTGFSLLSASAVWVACRAKFMQEWVEAIPGRRFALYGWTWPIAVVGMVGSVILSVAEYSNRTALKQHEALLEQAFMFDTSFLLVDAQTGLPIKSPSLRIKYGEGRGKSPSNVISHSTGERGDIRVGIQGIGWAPFNVTLSTPGYEDALFELNRNAPDEATVRMSPKKTKSSAGAAKPTPEQRNP